MKYRLLEISTLYNEYIKKYDSYNDCTYNELYNNVINDCYCESDFLHRYLQGDYKYETMIVYYNFQILQNKWDTNRDKNPFSILLRQIKDFKPNIILVTDLWILSNEQIEMIKECLEYDVHFIAYHFSVIDKQVIDVLKSYDMVFTGCEYYKAELSKYSSNVRVIRHAFEPSILGKVKASASMNKLGFVGSVFLGSSIHTNRVDMFSELKKNNIEYDYYGNVSGSMLNPRTFIDHFIHSPEKLLSRWNTINYLNNICNPGKYGIEYYNCIAQYTINLNIHAPILMTGAGNMRMFEVTGIGACLLTDYREENTLLFEEDKEIMVYRNNEELVDKAKYLITNPSAAKKIAQNGQKRTLNEYNYRRKAELYNRYITEI